MDTTPKSPILTTQQQGLRFALMLAIVLLLVVAFRLLGAGGIESSSGEEADPGSLVSAPDNPTDAISLEMQREEADTIVPLAKPIQIAWKPDMTLLDATKDAGRQSTEWSSKWQTSGGMYLLTELGGLGNDGESGLYWQFDLNGEYGKQGAGQTVLQPGDSVLWRLAPYR